MAIPDIRTPQKHPEHRFDTGKLLNWQIVTNCVCQKISCPESVPEVRKKSEKNEKKIRFSYCIFRTNGVNYRA